MAFKVLETLCIGCGACDYACTKTALTKTESFMGLFAIDPYRCDDCADCVPKCPEDAIVVDPDGNQVGIMSPRDASLRSRPPDI